MIIVHNHDLYKYFYHCNKLFLPPGWNKSFFVVITWQDILCTDWLVQAVSCYSMFQTGTCTVSQMRSLGDSNAPWDIHIQSDCLPPLQCYRSNTQLNIPCIQMSTDYLDTCRLDSVLEGVIFSHKSVPQDKDMNLV